jgi:hypothetical protein
MLIDTHPPVIGDRSLQYEKKKARFDKRKMGRLHYGPEWPTVNQPFEDEINQSSEH